MQGPRISWLLPWRYKSVTRKRCGGPTPHDFGTWGRPMSLVPDTEPYTSRNPRGGHMDRVPLFYGGSSTRYIVGRDPTFPRPLLCARRPSTGSTRDWGVWFVDTVSTTGRWILEGPRDILPQTSAGRGHGPTWLRESQVFVLVLSYFTNFAITSGSGHLRRQPWQRRCAWTLRRARQWT